MTITVPSGGGGGNLGIPPMPDGVTYNSVGPSAATNRGETLPLFSIVNNGQTGIETLSDYDALANDIVFYLNGVTQYAVSMNDIEALFSLGITQATGFIWYDNVDLAFYQIFKVSAGNALIKITNGGVITHIGTDSNTNYGFTPIMTADTVGQIMHRAAHGSGDFTLYYTKESAVDHDTVDIDSATGLASNIAEFILTGATLPPEGAVAYLTADKTASIGQITYISQANHNAYHLSFMRKGGYAALNMDDIRSLGIDTGNPQYPKYHYWDDKVALGGSQENNGVNPFIFGPRCFERIDFDKWIQDVCDYLGLPS